MHMFPKVMCGGQHMPSDVDLSSPRPEMLVLLAEATEMSHVRRQKSVCNVTIIFNNQLVLNFFCLFLIYGLSSLDGH